MKQVSGWLKSRQATGADLDKTASLLLDRMENDPYGYASQLEREAVKVLNKDGLAAFERTVRVLFEAKECTEQVRGRWSDALRAIYAQQQDVQAYVALCEQTGFSAQDSLAIAVMLKAQGSLAEALSWVERGLLLDKKKPYESGVGHDLGKLKRELLASLGRQDEALAEAWAEFQMTPSTYSFEELMRFVPKAERGDWHGKALDAAEHGSLGSLIDLLVETKETARLVRCIQEAGDNALENLSHYVTEPGADLLAETHPEVAAGLFRALGMRILKAKKSKYYHEALAHFESVRNCYARANMSQQWGMPWLRRCAESITARWALCRDSSGSWQARAPARNCRTSIVRGTAGYRAAHNRQRWSLAGLTNPSVASGEKELNRASSFLIFVPPPLIETALPP